MNNASFYTTALGLDNDPAALLLLESLQLQRPVRTEPSQLGEYFVRLAPCPDCGSPGLRHSNDLCAFCSVEYPDRNRAHRAGLAFWRPRTMRCRDCDAHTFRSVKTGRCVACGGDPLSWRSPLLSFTDRHFIERQPDAILTRATAIDRGRSIYRSGEPCQHGHRAYRYVETGECLECLKHG